jgi:transcriptional regulator with XRE-family HTH domain
MSRKPIVPKRRGRKAAKAPDGAAARLQQARERKGLTQTEAAELSGVHKDTWSGWEQGLAEKMGLDNARRVCKVLDILPSWLLFGDEGQRSWSA